ncbi:hypothetical protein [Pantoea sp. AS142]
MIPTVEMGGQSITRLSWLELQPGVQRWHRLADIFHTQDAWIT